MTAERWQQVKEIFHTVAPRDADARAQYLAERCVDDAELRSEVESLLASYDDPSTLLISQHFTPVAKLDLPDRYQIIEELGRGGMGIVYKARDNETCEVLALKVLKPEIAADAGFVDRFKNELRLAHRITPGLVAALADTSGVVRVSAAASIAGLTRR